jgi:hypothetical protein
VTLGQAGKADAEVMPDEAVRSVAADEESRRHGAGAAFRADVHCYLAAVIAESAGGVPAADRRAELECPALQQLLQAPLRYRQHAQGAGPDRIQPERQGPEEVARHGHGAAALLPAQQAALLQHGDDVPDQAVALRHGARLRGAFEHERADARPAELAGEHQAHRARADDHDVRRAARGLRGLHARGSSRR